MKTILTNVVVSLALLAGCLIFVSGCGEKPEGEKKKIVTIRYATYDRQPQDLESLVNFFEDKYPHIKVKVEFAGSRKILTEMAGGNPPDAFYCVSLFPYASRGVLLDLQPLVDEDKEVNLNDYFSVVVENCRYKGGLYGLPLHYGCDIMFYNKKLFDQAQLDYPTEKWTWQDFLRAAKQLTKDINGDGRIDQYGTAMPWYQSLRWIKENGGAVFDKEGEKCLLNNPEAIEATQFLADLKFKHKVTASLSAVTGSSGYDSGVSGMRQSFMIGKIGMLIGTTYMMGEFEKIKNFEWDIALIPKREGKKRVVTFGAGVNCISKGSKYPKETWEFIKFFSSEESYKLQYRGHKTVPALKRAAYSPEIFSFSPPEHIHLFMEAMDYAVLSELARIPQGDEIYVTIIRPELELVFLGKRTPGEALKRIAQRANRIMQSK